MERLRADELAELLAPYLGRGARIPDSLFAALEEYLQILERWNQKMNLTSIRDPREAVRRHFGESLLLGGLLPVGASTFLDLGSGAGFPGLPIQLLHPELTVTLAESQVKKATFLREVVRSLGLATTIFQGRAELLRPRMFDVVALRAVDRMGFAVGIARELAPRFLLLTTAPELRRLRLVVHQSTQVPDSEERLAALVVPRGTIGCSPDVPRGTMSDL